jgi:hypothetical protein
MANQKIDLKPEDLKVGHWYRAKRPTKDFFVKVGRNDRKIVWMSTTQVQYDSDTVRDGRHYPTVSMEEFLKWAAREVTEEELKEWNQ